jgi:hypothetical protein
VMTCAETQANSSALPFRSVTGIALASCTRAGILPGPGQGCVTAVALVLYVTRVVTVTFLYEHIEKRLNAFAERVQTFERWLRGLTFEPFKRL